MSAKADMKTSKKCTGSNWVKAIWLPLKVTCQRCYVAHNWPIQLVFVDEKQHSVVLIATVDCIVARYRHYPLVMLHVGPATRLTKLWSLVLMNYGFYCICFRLSTSKTLHGIFGSILVKWTVHPLTLPYHFECHWLKHGRYVHLNVRWRKRKKFRGIVFRSCWMLITCFQRWYRSKIWLHYGVRLLHACHVMVQ